MDLDIKVEKLTNEKGMIKNYSDNLDKANLIRENYSSPRYHYVRAKTQAEKGEHRSKLKEMCDSNNWIFIEDDSNNDVYISHENNSKEKIPRYNNKDIIITNFLRLKLNQHTKEECESLLLYLKFFLIMQIIIYF